MCSTSVSVEVVLLANRLKLCHTEVTVDRQIQRKRREAAMISFPSENRPEMTKAFINTISTCLNLKKGSDQNLGKAHGWTVFILNYSTHFQYCFETKITMRNPMQ